MFTPTMFSRRLGEMSPGEGEMGSAPMGSLQISCFRYREMYEVIVMGSALIVIVIDDNNSNSNPP